MYEQMIGELLARTARSQMVRQLAVNLGWEQAENADRDFSPYHPCEDPVQLQRFPVWGSRPGAKNRHKTIKPGGRPTGETTCGQ